MNARIDRTAACSLLGLLILTGCRGTGPVAATHTPFTLTEVHVAWLDQAPPEVTPSGTQRIRGWRHLWYDNADDDRLDGYNTVEANADVEPDGQRKVWGTFTVREKLDGLTADDFAGPRFDPKDIRQGQILWQGTWHLAGDGGTALGQNDKGMTAFYFWQKTADTNLLTGGGYILDPHQQ
ncbi:MAG: hypothetical protein H7A46_21995 [Verrucomicrobiales bacterium]|nr:hypothetical protein [Verrucomicrobiales bacterium]